MNKRTLTSVFLILFLSSFLLFQPLNAAPHGAKKEEAPTSATAPTPDPKAEKAKEKEKGHEKKEAPKGHGKEGAVYKPPKDVMDKAIPAYETPLGTMFTYEDKFAKEVTLVGDFNNWNPKITKFKQNSFKIWQVMVPLKRGTYSYMINVDGQWILDPLNPKKVSNDIGDERSLIKIEQGSEYFLKQFGYGLRESSAPKSEPLGIVFTYKNMDARSVSVAGSFNGWNKTQHEMHMNDNGIWSIRIPIPKGTYNYKFFVDNLWISDPMNKNTGYDELGQLVSTIKVTDDFIDGKKKPHAIERIPYKFKYYNPRLPSRLNIAVIGTFNNWDDTMHIMTDKDQDKTWEVIAYLEPGNYYYRFKIRNETFADPYNPKQKTWEDGLPASWMDLFQPPDRQFVKFIFKDTKKRKIKNVALSGDFNNYSPENDMMEWDSQNKNWFTIMDLPKGTYKYRFLINNRNWELDINNPDNVVDQQGTTWSLVSVGVTNKQKLLKPVKKAGHH